MTRARLATQALWVVAGLGALVAMLCTARAAGPVRIGDNPEIGWSDSAHNPAILALPDSLRAAIETGAQDVCFTYLINSGWRYIPGDTGIYVPVQQHPDNWLLHLSPDGWVEHWIVTADTSLYWIAVRIRGEPPCTTVVKPWRPNPSPSYR